MPVYAGTAPRRVAMLSVAISAAPESRATYTHGEIKGRPGVDALKYAADVTVDPSDFATLEKLAARVQASAEQRPVQKPVRRAGNSALYF